MRTTLFLIASLVLAPACGGDDDDDDDNDDDGIFDAAADTPDAPVDAPDAAGPDAAGPSCAAQTIEGCPEPCVNEVGAYWDGDSCEPIICCCEGPDCEETYDTMEQCIAARASCPGPRGNGQTCGESADGLGCMAGLVCCYPCGIPDCDYTCAPPCESGPGCDEASGCALVP